MVNPTTKEADMEFSAMRFFPESPLNILDMIEDIAIQEICENDDICELI
jgi:hypothetical protein